MITSNIFDGQTSLPKQSGSFYQVSGSLRSYAKTVAQLPSSKESGFGGNDHFISTARAISELWNASRTMGSDYVLKTIKQTPCLMNWFCMIITMIIFGKNEGNQLGAERLFFTDKPYLKVWKNKFWTDGKDDNQADDGTFQGQTEGLDIYTFRPGEMSSAAGCCSRNYFVIPPREVLPDESSSWKAFYFQLRNYPDVLEKNLTSKTSIIQKCLLLLTAASMPEDKPIAMIKEIIYKYINIKGISGTEIPCHSMGGISFFQIKNNVAAESESMFQKTLCLVPDGNQYAALYPFTEKTADALEKGECIARNLRLTVTEASEFSTGHCYIRSASVYAEFCFPLEFQDPDGNIVSVIYENPETVQYQTDDIYYAETMNTFCMYPDILFEYEDRCQQYTYLSVSSSFMKQPDNSRQKQHFAHLMQTEQAPCFDDIFSEAQRVKTSAKDTLIMATSNQPRHVIKTRDHTGNYTGSILNFRSMQITCPPFLKPDTDIQINIRKEPHQPAKEKMYAFVDFGNSSCMAGCQLPESQITSIVKHPIVRELLAAYDPQKYSLYLNLASGISPDALLPSACIPYHRSQHLDAFPFQQNLIPFSHTFTQFENAGMSIAFDSKLQFLSSQFRDAQQAYAILSGICYAAVCQAINEDCRELILFPSVPGESEANAFASLWDSIIQEVRSLFSIELTHMLHAPNRHLLFDTIAVHNHSEKIGTNVIHISIDIGDISTKISAVFCDFFNEKNLCAFSSLTYGGKHLLKAVIYDVLHHTKMQPQYAQRFSQKQQQDIAQALYIAFLEHVFQIPDAKKDAAAQILNTLCLKFIPNYAKIGKPRNDSWHLQFSELLSLAPLNDQVFDSKALADLTIRYAVLMPVIKDFISVARQMCNSDPHTVIHISFAGEASSGLLLINHLTQGNFFASMNQYFQKYFPLCNIDPPAPCSKYSLLQGLASYSDLRDANGEYAIQSRERIAFDWEKINPRTIFPAGSHPRAKACEAFQFREIKTIEDLNYNTQRRKTSACSIPGKGYPDFQNYMAEIQQFFLPDAALAAFLKQTVFLSANPGTQATINSQLHETAFQQAESCTIYPEMIQSTAYLMETCQLLSDYFGKGFSGVPITGKPDSSYLFSC